MSLFQIDAGKEWRGGQRQSFFLVRELRQKGYSIQYVVQPGSPLHQKALNAGLPVFPFKIRNEFDLVAVVRLAKAMKREKCLLVHFHDAHSAAVGSVAASLAKVPLKIISRRVDFPLKKNYFSRLKYMRNVDSIIAVSRGVEKVLTAGGVDPKVIQVVPDGIDFSAFDESLPNDYLRREFSFEPEDYLAGVVAQLVDHKGHKYLIQAAKILKEQAPRIKILIAGDGPLWAELNRQAREIQVEDMVYFLGFRNDVPQILASLDLFVLSSHLEGMGSSILDAMVYQLPVVATQTGGIPEVVIHGETGLLVPPRDPAALAEAILKLYDDRTLASRLGQRGYEVVHQKFSAQTMAEKIMLLYKELTQKKGIELQRRAIN